MSLNQEMFAWAANQSWIDVFSISVQILGNAPIEPLGDEGRAESFHLADTKGKLVISSGGNEVNSPTFSSYGGPPWTISIGGVHSQSRGESWSAAKGTDYVSDFLTLVQMPQTTHDDWQLRAGTSFSTPIVAGVVAGVIQGVRTAWNYTGNTENGTIAISQQGNHLASASIRATLNSTATYWTTTDFAAPEVSVECFIGCHFPSLPIPIGPEPWIQMGWGYLNASHTQTLTDALTGIKSVDPKPQAATDHMESLYTARQRYWALPIHSS
jgi:hypothetical protein